MQRISVSRAKPGMVLAKDVRKDVKASGFGFSGDEFVWRIQPAAGEKLCLNEMILTEIVGELENNLVEAKNFSMDIQSKSG